MNIVCPTPGMNVLVTGTSPGVMCVCGNLIAQGGEGSGTATTIRVRVLVGSVPPPLPPADPEQPGDVDVVALGQLWTAQNVPVPGSSSTGVPMTVIAWAQQGTSGWGAPQSVWCNAGGSNPTNCGATLQDRE